MPKKIPKKASSRKRKINSPKQFSGVVYRYVFVSLGIFLAFIALANIPITRELSAKNGTSVLGEDEKTQEDDKDDNSGSDDQDQDDGDEDDSDEQENEEEDRSGEQKKQEETRREGSGKSNESKTKTKVVTANGTVQQAETEGFKTEFEEETVDGQKVKIKVEDDKTTKVEIRRGELKLKYVFENGEIKIKAENEEGEEVELDEEEQDEIENEVKEEFEDEGIEVASVSGKTAIKRGRVMARTDFPLSVDVGTNQLIVTTPNGQKTVAILPDKAVENLIAVGLITTFDGSSASPSAGFNTRAGDVDLVMRKDVLVYRIKGEKVQKIFGFIPVNTSRTVFVSAQTNNVVAQEQPILAEIIDLISP